MGCTTVPTTISDPRLSEYTPKVTSADFVYDPYKTPIAQIYKKELNKEEPHSIIEDFTYKKPYAIIIENCAYKGLENWKDVYKQICKHLAKKNEKLFDSLSSNKELISKQNKKYFTTDKKEIRRAEKITEKTFVEINLSANDFVKRIQEIFTVFKLHNDDIIIYLRQDRNA